LPKPMRLDRSERSTVATIDMPSRSHIDRARSSAERLKPIKATKVRGANAFAFRGVSLSFRLISTTRTECRGRLFASLAIGQQSVAARVSRVSIHVTFPECKASKVWDQTCGERVWHALALRGKGNSPNNIPDVVDVIPIVA
jgi:hypothetical protein